MGITGTPPRVRGSRAQYPTLVAGQQHYLNYSSRLIPSRNRNLAASTELLFLCTFPPRSPSSTVHCLCTKQQSVSSISVLSSRLLKKIWCLLLSMPLPPPPMPEGGEAAQQTWGTRLGPPPPQNKPQELLVGMWHQGCDRVLFWFSFFSPAFFT